jgi:hypothetical protein
MNTLLIAAGFARSVAERVTNGALPPREHLDEWAIYQHDLEMTRTLAEASDQRPDVIFGVSDGPKVQAVPK